MGKGGYGLTYQEVYEMENLTIEAKAIYGMLCSYAGSKAMAYPSVDFICDKLKISRTRFCTAWSLCIIEDITSCTWNKKCHYKSYRRIHWCRGIIWSNFYDRYGFR